MGTSKRFEGKVVLVTGGGSGMGLAAAQRMAKEGASAVVIAGRTEGKLKDAVSHIQGESSCDVFTVTGDVSSQKGCDDIVKQTVDKFGRIDCAFLNAGQGQMKPFAEVTEDDFDSLFGVNTKSAVFGIAAVAKVMKEQSTKGSILVNSSGLGSKCSANLPPMSVYSAAKAASDMFVKHAAVEYAEAGIRVNTISPGVVFTPIQQQSEEEVDKFGASCQLVGRAGRSEEIAATVAHLLSDEASFITGANIDSDGGFALKG